MKCSDVMTKNPTCCSTTDMVSKAAMMMQQEDVGSLPVCDTDKKLVGMVTDRDLALRVVAANRHPGDMHVQDVMTTNPVTCYPDDDLEATLDAMTRHQVRRIPVVNGSGQVVGIIAQADIALRTENERRTAEVVEEISRPAY